MLASETRNWKLLLDSRLEAVAEAERDDRIILEDFRVVADLLLLGLDIALDRRIAGNVPAVQSAGIAGAAGESERGLRSALKHGSHLNRRAEMLGARNQISPTNHHHRRNFVQGQFARADKGIAGAAAIANIIQGEGLTDRHIGISCDLIAVVEQQAGAQVESAAEGKEVEQSIHGAQVESAFVRNPVIKKVATVIQRASRRVRWRDSKSAPQHQNLRRG